MNPEEYINAIICECIRNRPIQEPHEITLEFANKAIELFLIKTGYKKAQ